jgi:hypothetical protein
MLSKKKGGEFPQNSTLINKNSIYFVLVIHYQE